MNAWIQDWLVPATGAHAHEVEWLPTPIGLLTILVVAAGVGLGWWLFGRNPIPVEPPQTASPFTIAGRNDLFGDAVNDTLVVAPTMVTARSVVAADDVVIDGGANGLASMFQGLSAEGRRLQTGQVRSYALTMMAGVVLVGLVMILSQLG
jgi:NADH-quinone oxidoreductase subunit L